MAEPDPKPDPARGRLSARARLRLILSHPLAFAQRVWRGARRNQLLLLSGALAYNALLSIVPFFALILLGLSLFMDQEDLLRALRGTVELVVPGQAAVVVDQIRGLLEGRELLGWVSIGMLVFFSASAFLVLEGALERIFAHRRLITRRHPLVSMVIPYSYMLVLGAGLVLLSVTIGLASGLEERMPHSLTSATAELGGFLLLVLLLTSLYKVMPAGRIGLGQAFVGGFAAAALWEVVRHILAWYFSNLSAVNLVYGSLATVIVVLLLMEIGALIILLGAQVIAEYDRFVFRERYRRRPGRFRG